MNKPARRERNKPARWERNKPKMKNTKFSIRILNSSLQRNRHGAVLLEVILSLSIFFIAAGIIFAGMSSSIKAVRTLRTRMRATDLGVTKISELKMGLIEPISTGPEPFDTQSERLKDWQWRIETSSAETTNDSAPMIRVTVTIIQTKLDQEYQLTTFLPASDGELP